MKKNVFLLVMVFITSMVLLTGCQQDDGILHQDSISQEVINDAKAYYGKVITLNDFPKDKLLDVSYMDKLNQNVQSGDIGSTPENAIVLLVFDKDLVLYTPQRYNDDFNSDKTVDVSTIKEYIIDIETYKKITGVKEATTEYAQGMPGTSGKLIWSFDAYVKFFEKKAEKENQTEKKFRLLPKVSKSQFKASSTVPDWGKKGNIIYGRWDGILSVSNYVGHTAGITTEISASYLTKTAQMYNTYTTEAVSTDVGTVTRRMTNSTGTSVWNASSIYNRAALWLSSLTTTQRNNIASYQVAQAGEPYVFGFTTAERDRTDRWYCSKLQWRAYKDYTGINIDKDGGSVVYPNDIYNNSSMVGISFGLA